jgi:hypothetical protein
MVIRLVKSLYVLAWLVSVATPADVERVDIDGDDDVFARLRESSGGPS